jgi:hypothetical protein
MGMPWHEGDEVRDLLRVIRNKMNHFRELPPKVQDEVGAPPDGRSLHSCTFWLNVSAFCWTGGAFKGCLEVASGAFRRCWGL